MRALGLPAGQPAGRLELGARSRRARGEKTSWQVARRQAKHTGAGRGATRGWRLEEARNWNAGWEIDCALNIVGRRATGDGEAKRLAQQVVRPSKLSRRRARRGLAGQPMSLAKRRTKTAAALWSARRAGGRVTAAPISLADRVVVGWTPSARSIGRTPAAWPVCLPGCLFACLPPAATARRR